MDINTIIAKKRNGGLKSELTKDEIKYFVGKYTKGEISDVQAAALMSYIYVNGLTENEIVEFVKEIGSSGDVLDLTKVSYSSGFGFVYLNSGFSFQQYAIVYSEIISSSSFVSVDDIFFFFNFWES